MISGFLEHGNQWVTLAVLSRSSKRLRSIYEARLYKTTKPTVNPRYRLNSSNIDPSPGSNHLVKALMWGIINESVAVMAQAQTYGADINAHLRGCHGSQVNSTNHGASINRHSGFGTMPQHAVQRGLNRSVEWLLKAGARIVTPGLAAVNLCRCAPTQYGEQEVQRSTLHLAVCRGYLETATLILDSYLGPSAFAESQHYDQGQILHTAMQTSIYTTNVGFLSKMLEYPSLRQLVDVPVPTGCGGHTTLLHKASCHASMRAPELRDITGMDMILATLVRKGGASTGLHPAGAINEGFSPLVDALRRDDYPTAGLLLRLGCDPDGTARIPWLQLPASALHCLISNERAYRDTNPEWISRGYGIHNPRRPFCLYNLRLFERRARAKETIKALLCHGASPMLKGGALDASPLDNAMSHGERFLPLTHRVAAYKVLRLILQYAKKGKITKVARAKATAWMDQIKADTRAERAVYTLSDWRVRRRLELAGHKIPHEPRVGNPIILPWKGASHGANGGRLVKGRM